jgi:hypothetical protein
MILLGVIALALGACAPTDSPKSTNPAPTALSPTPLPQSASAAGSVKLLPEEPVPFNTSAWKTNFKKHTVPFSEILSGGPPKDGIPAIDDPNFVSTREASEWLKDNEPVILFEHKDDARAYPLQILTWHEIVNDTVGGLPIAVTFCPLCNASIVFDRTVAGEATTFGTTGNLHYSDLVMYDRASESWWQQMTGEAIVGDRVGTKLNFLFSQVVAFADFKARYADGKVLSRDTGYARSYGANPYIGYDSPDNFPFLYEGPRPPSVLKPTERVVTLALGDAAVAYPYAALAQERVVNDSVAGQDIVVFWKGGTASALDGRSIASSRDIGATGVFSRVINDKRLTFFADGDTIKDKETGTTWSILGRGVEGALAGQQLAPIGHGNFFWFAWAAFRPDSKVYGVK